MNINLPENFEELKNAVKLGVAPAEWSRTAMGEPFLDIQKYIYLPLENAFAYPCCHEATEETEELWQAAAENTKNSFTVVPLLERMAEMMEINIEDINAVMKFTPAVTITNEENIRGAAAILFPDILDQAADMLESATIMIIPSSIHELIVIPYDGTFDYKGVNQLVKEINEEIVTDEDFLSDSVYLYTKKDRRIQLY